MSHLLRLRSDLKSLILENPSVEQIRGFTENNYSTLKMEGHKKVKQGQTSLAEISRAVYIE
jgi:type II secretory ATPase GspE/PulE/Tfp pilus assembly ATPase PilB-like protein